MRSNRAFSQAAGHYACDLFIGSTLQIDLAGNSSTATKGRIAGFGGAPNMGADARGRRHASPAWLRAGREDARATGDAPGAEAGGPDRRDLPGAHGARLRRAPGCLGGGRKRGHGPAAGDDLRRGREPHHHGRGHRQLAAVPECRRTRAGHPRGGRLYARSAWPGTGERWKTSGTGASCGVPRTWASTRGWRPGIFWRRAPSRIWSAPPGDSTTLPNASGTGRPDMETLTFEYQGGIPILSRARR